MFTMSTKKRTYKSKLREQNKRETINNILTAAVKLHGKGDTALESLAEEAGVSVATIRKNFPTKEELFKGCTEHFIKTHNIPSLSEISSIEEPAERLVSMVREIYSFFEAAMGHNWLAYRLQDESPVMAETILQMESFVQAATEMLLREWSLEHQESNQHAELYGFVSGLLSPLTYRSLRMLGRLQPDQCIRQTIITIAARLEKGGT